MYCTVMCSTVPPGAASSLQENLLAQATGCAHTLPLNTPQTRIILGQSNSQLVAAVSPPTEGGSLLESRGTASMHSPGSSERQVTASRSVWKASMMESRAGGGGEGGGGGGDRARGGGAAAAAAAASSGIATGGSMAVDGAAAAAAAFPPFAAREEAAREQTSFADAALNLRTGAKNRGVDRIVWKFD